MASNQRQNEPAGDRGPWLALGPLLGVTLGLLINNLGLGIALGLLAGAVLSEVTDSQNGKTGGQA